VTTTQRRQGITFLPAAHGYSARPACGLVHLSRSRGHYGRRRPLVDAPIRTRLVELAEARPRFGYERMHVLLRREGMVVNHKRVYRLYREARRHVRPRRRKRVAAPRVALPAATAVNARWGMDFIHDQCADGRHFRCLSMSARASAQPSWWTCRGARRRPAPHQLGRAYPHGESTTAPEPDPRPRCTHPTLSLTL
jgi:putative transposase